MLNKGLTINDRYCLQLAGVEQRSAATSVGNPADWLTRLLGIQSTSGAVVNDETSLTLPAVFSCVRILSDTLGTLKVGLYRRLPNGDVRPAPHLPEDALVSRSPSALYTPYTFRSTMQASLSLRGNAYSRILRNGHGRAQELRFIHPNCVRPYFYNDELFYEITPNPQGGYSKMEHAVRPEDMLHIVGLSTDGIIGKSPIHALRDTIGMGLTTREYAGNILKNGGIMRGTLKAAQGQKYTPEQINDIRENFKKPLLNGEIPLLQNGLEFQTITLTPADSEFINTAKLTRSDVAGAYRIAPHMIGDLDHATFTNIEQQALEFTQYSVSPLVENWEQELTRKLIPVAMQGEYFYSFNLDALMRGDTNSRTTYYMRARQWGWMSVNEIRAQENMPFIPEGDTYLTPLNMVDSAADVSGDQATPNNDLNQPNPAKNGR